MLCSRLFHPRFLLCMLGILVVLFITPSDLFSVTSGVQGVTTQSVKVPSVPTDALQSIYDMPKTPSLLSQAVALSFLSMLPFIIMILSSFVKIVVVLSLLRSALGVQQAPPNQVINGIAFLLSLYVMYPTAARMYDAGYAVMQSKGVPESFASKEAPTYILELAAAAGEPLREFLKKNSSVAHQKSFYRIAYKVIPESHRPDLQPDNFLILVPAFITSQLKEAFEIGVLIYIPFFVIDLVTSNILLAMGMMMLSPVTISMPLKLFLLVMLDGWSLLIEGLVNTFH